MDVGSTTLKCVAVDDNGNIVYKKYERHYARITEKTAAMLSDIAERFGGGDMTICVSGSAGMGLSETLGLPFAQEVYATRTAVSALLPNADVAIELGGEDAKILFLTGGLEVRMNGSCAGGTGAFIDQMAALLEITPIEMNALAASSDKIYTVASRCGVFAKSDIQPLLSQGARKSDVAASIFYAVVNQTVAGLAQGREITGKVAYLGGPLTFLSELRKSFDSVLGVEGICPENSLYYVAYGAAISPESCETGLGSLIERIRSCTANTGYISCMPLFESREDYAEFQERHKKNTVERVSLEDVEREVFLGVDGGSTTVKAVVTDSQGRIIFSDYMRSSGDPVPLVKSFLERFYARYTKSKIVSSAVTGYGEELLKNAFSIDFGVVETAAHFAAAKKFLPEVDFIIDVGGQDIKCFKIRNSAIDNIFLNEACSSGCGSFLQTFAGAWGYGIEDFANLGLFAEAPVDLGSRCTVFMNSSVKQAQKDGASIENISAGLSVSVVKNALYKVIRAADTDDLGKRIVVQGGTFLNDAVLRAFECETGRDVVRPDIAGLMGAYGAALYAQSNSFGRSAVLTAEALKSFRHEVKSTSCGGCPNSCRLTVNSFGGGRSFIGGNRCEKPLSGATCGPDALNLFEYKKELLNAYRPVKGPRGTIGIPMGLNMYELLPFWHTLLTRLGFEVIVSPESNRKLYLSGQHTIPSDTVCYPAKLLHGHIEALLQSGVRTIFYPCLTYNFDEGLGDNHYNCPVVAYYPEVIRANVPALRDSLFICDYLGIHRRRDFTAKFHGVLSGYFGGISFHEVKDAADAAYDEYESYMKKIRLRGKEILRAAEKQDLPVIILAGRPYHLDSEVNHSIDRLVRSCGAAVITEEAVSGEAARFPTRVLNQWTYHARLYAAAKYAAESKNKKLNLVQLVSFGCGVDAITTDEVRSILEDSGRIYTQIKIDEITNPGAVKIRLRSLFAAAGIKAAEAGDIQKERAERSA